MRYSLPVAATVGTITAALAAAECPNLELIYARATTEPKGFGAAGGSLAKHLKTDLPGSSAYAVNYPADMQSLNTCTGPIDLIKRVKERVDSCPGIKLALGGHSQGGAVVAVATPQIPEKYLSSIVAVTMFGSPPCSDLTKSSIAGVKELGARCKSFCNKGDTICDSTGPMGNGGPRAKCVIKQQIRGLSGGISIYQGTAYPSFVAPPPLNESEALQLRRFNEQAATCGEDERGHVSKGGGGMAAHMAYNQDGYYVAAASCYIAKQYKASTAGAAGQKAALSNN